MASFLTDKVRFWHTKTTADKCDILELEPVPQWTPQLGVRWAIGSPSFWSEGHQRNHRRRIKTEEKANVVLAAVWGTELIQFLAAVAILHQDDYKKGMNSSYSSYRPGAINPMPHIVLVQFILFFKLSLWEKQRCQLSVNWRPHNHMRGGGYWGGGDGRVERGKVGW